jgi:hypothetical protein
MRRPNLVHDTTRIRVSTFTCRNDQRVWDIDYPRRDDLAAEPHWASSRSVLRKWSLPATHVGVGCREGDESGVDKRLSDDRIWVWTSSNGKS